jgi:predicted kinase
MHAWIGFKMELIIFIGLQASGKSTFFRTHFAEIYEYVSKDVLRNNKRPGRRQMQLIESALQAQRSVVVDNTNPTVEDRAPLIHLGKMYGATIIGYFFESQVSTSIKHNKQRAGKARVPDVAIYVTAKKLIPPTYAEGFDRLYDVRIANDSGFEVQERSASSVTSDGLANQD